MGDENHQELQRTCDKDKSQVSRTLMSETEPRHDQTLLKSSSDKEPLLTVTGSTCVNQNRSKTDQMPGTKAVTATGDRHAGLADSISSKSSDADKLTSHHSGVAMETGDETNLIGRDGGVAEEVGGGSGGKVMNSKEEDDEHQHGNQMETGDV